MNGTHAVRNGRFTAEAPEGTVVFLIGMRLNKLRKVRQWLTVFTAMPQMLAELRGDPALGLLSTKAYLSGRTVLLVQYWQSAGHLDRFATGPGHSHLPAWREFNRRIRASGDVGIFHETYVADRFETIYGNMPGDFGLGGATQMIPPGRRGQRAAHRLDPSVPDQPAVAPY